jgi:integrase
MTKQKGRAVKLTDLYVQNIKAKTDAFEVRDLGQPHLWLYVSPSGKQSYRMRYRFQSKPCVMVLPTGITLAQARKIVSDAMFKMHQEGVDPRAVKRTQKEQAERSNSTTVRSVIENYMRIEGKKLRTVRARERIFERFIYPRLGSLQISDISPEVMKPILDGIETTSKGDADGQRMRDMVLMNVKRVLNWYASDSTFVNPIAKMKSKTNVRQRIRKVRLEDNELAAIWKATLDPSIAPTYGACIRLLLLTGARKSEVAGIRRSEITHVREDGKDYVVWKLPANPIDRHRNKVGKSMGEVVRPLSKAALQIIFEDMPQIGDSDLVFTVNGRNPYAMSNTGQKERLEELSGVSGKRLHDLRRTFRTLCSRRRIPKDVAERCVGHTVEMLEETYNQHSFYEQMQEAVDAVASEISRIVSGEGDAKVIRERFA